jgi:TetR/AcrR family transcriptional regulator, regulator of cefoperazone and chloramphenicol sensitivity
MKSARKQNGDTRERLLKSACEVFAKKGYRDATIADISRLARTNIAAVNYHFHNKKSLYIEAWRQAFHRSLEAYPADGGVGPDAPAEKRLYGRILSFMQRFADPNSHEFEIFHKEIVNPTGFLTEVMHKSIEPMQQESVSIVRKLLGGQASERQVLLCMRSIMTQCFDPKRWERNRRIHEKAGIGAMENVMNFTIEEIAEHVTRFSLAGIREIRCQVEAGKLNDQNETTAAIADNIDSGRKDRNGVLK